MIRAGIVGAGYIARAHAAAYAALPNVELVAIADANPDRAQALANYFGAEPLDSVEALLALDIDMVSICTPTPTHAQLAIAAMRAGKHVLCEKPIARSVADAEAMIAEAERCGVKLMVGHVSRFEVDHAQAAEVVRRGDLGELRMASQAITGAFPDWGWDGWFSDVTRSGGPLVDLAIHSIDFILWLFNSPVQRVTAVGVQRELPLHTYILATLKFENGGMATVECSWAHPNVPGEAVSVITELSGTEGKLSWSYDSITSMHVYTSEGKRNIMMAGENSFATEIGAFVKAIEEDTTPPVTGSEALDALRVALAALESLETGKTVVVNGR